MVDADKFLFPVKVSKDAQMLPAMDEWFTHRPPYCINLWTNLLSTTTSISPEDMFQDILHCQRAFPSPL